ncbi:MAG TPA: MFS transporter [Candidatus Baltobacteraceae bacterium]|nr:MFS transporter [Candidatus Baltobacteraceae bacterium]
MSPRWRVLALMTGAQAGASVVQQALGSLSPILVGTFALSKAQLGIVFTALMLGSTAFTALAGALTDKWGEKKMLLAAGALMAAGLLGAAALVSYPWLIACMTVYGAGYAVSTPAGGRAILTWFDRDRGFAMGVRQAGVPLGGTVGALALPVLAQLPGGYRTAFVVSALLVAVPTLFAYAFYEDAPSAANGAAPPRVRDLLRGMTTLARDPRLIAVTVTSMVLVSVQLAMNAFVTVTGVVDVGLAAGIAALAFALAQATAIAGRLWWGFASDRFFGGDRLVPFALICVIAVIACAALGVLHRGAVVPLFVASALLGLSGAGWNGLMAAAMVEVGGAERAASALGLALTAIYGASAIAPWAFGVLADATSLRVAWLATATLAFAGVGPVLWLRARLAAAPAPRPREV